MLDGISPVKVTHYSLENEGGPERQEALYLEFRCAFWDLVFEVDNSTISSF